MIQNYPYAINRKEEKLKGDQNEAESNWKMKDIIGCCFRHDQFPWLPLLNIFVDNVSHVYNIF